MGEIVGEGMRLQAGTRRTAAREKVDGWIERVGLERGHAARCPHELSGGQHRAGTHPEPEVRRPRRADLGSVQAQIVHLLGELKASVGVTMLLIAHDLSMV